MQNQNVPKKPLNDPDHITALIQEGMEAMMKKQMKQMMKTIKEGIEEILMTSLRAAAATSPDLEGAATAIADTGEAITTEIIAKAKAVLVEHVSGTGGAAPANLVPMPFRVCAPTPLQTTVGTSPAPIAVIGPPPFIAPGVAAGPVPPPVFIPPRITENCGAPPPCVPTPSAMCPAAVTSTGAVVPPGSSAQNILPETTNSLTVAPPMPSAADKPRGASKAATPCTPVPGLTVPPAPLMRKPGRRDVYGDNPLHIQNPLTGEWHYPVRTTDW